MKFEEIAKTSSDVVSLMDTGVVPEVITIGGQKFNKVMYLQALCFAILELGAGTLGDIIPIEATVNPDKPTQNLVEGQLLKTEIIQRVAEIYTFIQGNKTNPGLHTTTLGTLTLNNCIYTYSRVLNYYYQTGAFPNYVNVYKKFGNTQIKGPIQLACEQLLGTFNTITEFYNKCLGRGYSHYLNDLKTLEQEYTTIKNLNCVDATQLLLHLALEMGYEVRYAQVKCTQSGEGHVYGELKGKELGNSWVKMDLAACMSTGSMYPIGKVWCADATPTYNPDWLKRPDDGIT